MSYEIESGERPIPTPDGLLPAFCAAPRAEGRRPVIVVIHEVYGVYGHLDALCRDWAEQGYFVVAPLLFSRVGDVHRAKGIEEIHQITNKISDAQVQADLDAVFAWLKDQPHADTARIGITGFCWGGRHVWLYAAHNPAVRAGVSWYGGPLDGEPTAMRPSHPIEHVGELKAPVLGLYGGSDVLIPMDMIERMQRALEAQAPGSSIHVYPNAKHGFHAPSRPNHDPDASRDGDARLLEWFRVNGVA